MDVIEYRIIDTATTGVPLAGEPVAPYRASLEAGLNRLGEDGWRLADVSGTLMIFTRRGSAKRDIDEDDL